MFTLLTRSFTGIERGRFTADLDAKNWVLLVADAAQRLVGFTTFLLYDTFYEGRPLTVVYSGDTIVDSSSGGSSALLRSWITCVQSLKTRQGPGALQWLLLTSGFRTYRLLPVFLSEFYPRYDRPTPPDQKRLLDHLAETHFWSHYSSETGVVRFPHPQVLRPHLGGIPEGRLNNPHVAFFQRANPGHGRGDELVCLAEIAPSNLTRAGQRMVRAGSVEGPAKGDPGSEVGPAGPPGHGR